MVYRWKNKYIKSERANTKEETRFKEENHYWYSGNMVLNEKEKWKIPFLITQILIVYFFFSVWKYFCLVINDYL